MYRNTYTRPNKLKEKEYEPMEPGESIVDTSSYIPELSQLQALRGQTKTKKYYDFEDGKDDGLNLYQMRTLGMDITEQETIKNAFKQRSEEMLGEIQNEALAKMQEVINTDNKNNNAVSNQSNNTTTSE